MMRKLSRPDYLLLLACMALLVLAACSGVESGRRVVPISLKITERLDLPITVGKCLFDQYSSTYYLLEKNRPNILLYRNGKQINTIGGFGSDRMNFQKLSDIALDSDGNLLALDSFARLVRKYSPDGKWITDIELTGFTQPSDLCSTAENDLIIYDSAVKELKRISGFDGRIVFSFGRFQVESVSNLSANRNMIAVVNESGDETILFSAMGLYQKDYPAQMVLDQYMNQYYYRDAALHLDGQDVILPLGWQDAEVKLFSAPQSLLVVKGKTVISVLPVYQKR